MNQFVSAKVFQKSNFDSERLFDLNRCLIPVKYLKVGKVECKFHMVRDKSVVSRYSMCDKGQRSPTKQSRVIRG